MLQQPRLTLVLLTCMAGACFAQAEPPGFYHLDFAVKEIDAAKVANVRHYWTTVETGEHPACSIRTGSRVPVPAGETGSTFTYIEVGVNIDCSNVRETGGGLALSVTAEVSGAAVAPNTKQPVIRQNKWNGKVTVPAGKATLIFSSDDVASKGQMQIELTATPVK